MKFALFILASWLEKDASAQSRIYDEALEQVEFAEELGFDSVWVAEHHSSRYGIFPSLTPILSYMAARTKKIRIGTGVSVLPFHNPIRLAEEAAMLDLLSKGRLEFGVGRGSAFNTYEYLGFGIPMEEAEERLAEAEELIVKSWTTENLTFKGKFWNVKFPALRPVPYQKPHPPIVRACISEASTLAMARIGRPILIGVQTAEDTANRLSSYKTEMLGTGFTEKQTENALNQIWVARNMFVAETESKARELAQPGFARERKHFREAREIYNPEGFPPLDTSKPLPVGEDFDQATIIGTPSQVADQVAELRDLGVRNLMLKINVGEMDTDAVQKAIKLFGESVMPKFPE